MVGRRLGAGMVAARVGVRGRLWGWGEGGSGGGDWVVVEGEGGEGRKRVLEKIFPPSSREVIFLQL